MAVGAYANSFLSYLDNKSIKIQEKHPKAWKIIDATVLALAFVTVAEVINKNNYQMHRIVLNQCLVAQSLNLAKKLSEPNNRDEQPPK